MNTALIEAYRITIEDFEKAYRNTGLFNFKERRRISKEIDKFNNLIKKEENKQ